MDSLRAFDDAARSVELRLAELRRLLAGQETLTDAQLTQLAVLLPTLEAVSSAALALRNDVLNAPDAPVGFVERGYESLPTGFDPTGWTTETYVTPITAAWGQQFTEKPGGEITVDSLFEGDEPSAEAELLTGPALSRLVTEFISADDSEGSENLDEGDPTSRVPRQPIPPATPVGAGRTLAEALEEPRNP